MNLDEMVEQHRIRVMEYKRSLRRKPIHVAPPSIIHHYSYWWLSLRTPKKNIQGLKQHYYYWC